MPQQYKATKFIKQDEPPDLVLESNTASSEKRVDDGNDNVGSNAAVSTNHHSRTLVPPRLDSFLQNYGKFSASTFTADQGLKILQWSSWAISYLTRTNNPHKHLSTSLNKLYNEMSMTRYALRFYGFFQSLEGYLNGSWAGGEWDNPLIGKIAKYIMAGSMLLYYPLEHVAYAGWQMPKMVKVDANRFSAVSCRFWTAYIVGDFWISCLKWAELKEKLCNLSELLAGKKQDDDKEAVRQILEQQQCALRKLRHLKLQVLRCLLFILPAVNWSLPNWATKPMLSEPILNGLMLTEAYTSVYQSLRGMIG